MRVASLLGEGARLQSAGDAVAAEQTFRRALELQPRNAEARFLLGSLLGRLNRADEALAHLAQSVEANPDAPDAQTALGNVYLMKGNLEAAQNCYAQALRLAPENPAASFNLGLLAQCGLDFNGALANFERTWALAPQMEGLLRNLTLARIELGRFEIAETQLQEIYAQRPDDPEVLFSLGYTLQNSHRPQLAIRYYERARELGFKDADLFLHRGIVLRDLGRIDEAIDSFNTAIAVRAGFEVALWHRTLAYLLQHDFARGWQHYDLRLRSRDRLQRPSTYPEWPGQNPADLRLLIYGEQGLGDEIMFASCLPQMIAASRSCIVECSEKLLPLIKRSFPGALVRLPQANGENEAIDMQVAMGSLPKYLRRQASDFPQHQGYLHANPARIEKWRKRLSALGPGPKVGISWRGGSYKTRSPVRSIPLEQWTAILQISGVHFVDLQYTDCSDEVSAAEQRFGAAIHRWPEAREDFEETAALVSSLDLVVSVCTTVIHLAGALARPVWVMAPFSPEWRYGARGEAMPWYPSARLFRQPAYAAWEPVIADVAQSLQALRDCGLDTQH